MLLGDDVRPVQVRTLKWGGHPHWEFTGVLLGTDEHGTWIGFASGTWNTRPGFDYVSEVDCVTLVPPADWWVATFHRPGIWCTTYVDMATPAAWEDAGAPAPLVLRVTDLDLDVIRRDDGTWFVDDEDEFALHRVRYGYPEHVVRAAEDSCARVLALSAEGAAPFDGAAERWLDALGRLDPGPLGPRPPA